MNPPKLETDPAQRLFNTLQSGKVRRYHAVPTVLPQDVGQHAWGVAVLLVHIADEVPTHLLVEALLHDSGEIYSGDIPFTVKQSSASLKAAFDTLEHQGREALTIQPPLRLTEREAALLKLCDTLEGFCWCNLHEHGTTVEHRWVAAFERCKAKFGHLINIGEWERAQAVFDLYRYAKYQPL